MVEKKGFNLEEKKLSQVGNISSSLITFKFNKKINLREKLAELEHEQWISWSNYVANHNDLPKELLDKWVVNWKPYPKLDEKTKDSDRIWADKVLILFEQWKKEFINRLRFKFRKLSQRTEGGLDEFFEEIDKLSRKS